MINDESLHARPAASCMQDGCQVTVHMRHDLPHESPLQLQLPPQQCRGHCGQLRSSPRCTRGNEPLLRCLITAHIAESDVIEQLSGKVLSSQFQFNHKMLFPKWKGTDVTFQSAIYPSSQVLFEVLIELIFIFRAQSPEVTS